ncbi:hypothetical protein [Nitrospira sp. Kam-Ns4a]
MPIVKDLDASMRGVGIDDPVGPFAEDLDKAERHQLVPARRVEDQLVAA